MSGVLLLLGVFWSSGLEARTGPCDGPDADPWVVALRDRVLTYDGLARLAVDRYGAPIACEGAVTAEFDGTRFGFVHLGFPTGVRLRVETVPPWLTDGLANPRRHGLSPASIWAQFGKDAIYRVAMVNPSRLSLALPLLTLPLLGCELVQGCSARFVYGIEVELRPGFATPPDRNEAFGFVREGDYVDSLRVQAWTQGAGDSVESVLLVGAGQRPGTYAVVVRRPGYLQWDTASVAVNDDGCHPETVTLQVVLRPVP